jgi:outer membrane immunogenic protein
MKHRISALALFAALGAFSAGAAVAADLPSRKGPPPVFVPPPPTFTWTGAYVGLNLGGGWLNNNDSVWGRGSNGAGVVGGGQLGYNYQFSPLFVAGVETDIQGSSIGSGGNTNFAPFWVPGRRVNWFGTLRGRLGISVFDPHLLFYGTGGLAYGGVTAGYFGGYNNVNVGWTAGAGVEWAFMPNWSAKVEYLYTDMSNSNNNWWTSQILGVLPQRGHTRFNTVRAGVNYHFNFGGGAPVYARY